MYHYGRNHLPKIVRNFTPIICISLVLLYVASKLLNTKTSTFHLLASEPPSPFICSLRGQRWIVITTIFYPTLAIHKFLNLSTQWNLVIVADRKTPTDWMSRLHRSDQSRVLFLSLDGQRSLGYSILQYLPEGSYARKNIGYLVAIACGAKIIFESDDDNLLETNDIRVLPKEASPNDVPWVSFHRQRSPFVNIYGSFGQPHIWPRGFPVDELRNVTEDGWHSVRRNQDKITNTYIQQYLADLDPDVDALYRLTHPLSIGRIQFDPQQPPIAIQPFTFSPYNTQNTVTHYEAFWGLYLPVTTTFRVCDIWRGFWVQRLLWDIDGRLVFSTATVKQVRNAHSYIKDMDDESQLYHQSGSFVRFLTSWSSSLPSLAERIAQLAIDIAHGGFWNVREVDIMKAWLHDLQSVGYVFPSIVSRTIRSTTLEKRAVVCITGYTKCAYTWNSTDFTVRQRLQGDIDTILFLSSSFIPNSMPLIGRRTSSHAHLNVTMAVFYEDRVIDPMIPDDCHIRFHLPKNTSAHIHNYLQQLWSAKQCYDLVKDYERRFNLRYQLLVHTHINTLTRMPEDTSYVNRTVILSSVRYNPHYDDGFTLGPLNMMQHYMTRWDVLRHCPSDNNHRPDMFRLKHLSRFANFTVDVQSNAHDNVAKDKANYC
ncbi:unnamed protein product [Adineta ricciae]|uniref:Uncharacterized protein n=1 Tax=Adineta ricciae TaxID=249248 RepID=A0A814MQZ1_ADIRI|nr:unnamed protein product [Adineta ricciae]CAF1185567.1 unnamed protein product [Adineta ricciae]